MIRVALTLDKLVYPRTGLGQFSSHLAGALAAGAEGFDFTWLLPSAADGWLPAIGGRRVRLHAVDKEKVLRWTRPLGPFTGAQRCRPDVWHVLAQDAKYLPFDRATPLLLTLHDLNFLRDAGTREQPRRLALVQSRVDRSTVITTGSRFSADEIRARLDVGDRSIHVIPHGLPPREAEPTQPPLVPHGPFLFGIGDIVPRKNFAVLPAMMERLPDLHLVLAGRCDTAEAADIARAIDQLGLNDRVRLVGSVSDGERQWYYQNAAGVVVPSVTEGFGLPVIEGMAEGRPVFLSRSTSLPEVAGELGHYWDDYQSAAMASVVRQGLAKWSEDPSLAVQTRAHAAQFTWERAAEAYRSLYRSLAV